MIIIKLENNLNLLIHLKMTGQLIYSDEKILPLFQIQFRLREYFARENNTCNNKLKRFYRFAPE